MRKLVEILRFLQVYRGHIDGDVGIKERRDQHSGVPKALIGWIAGTPWFRLTCPKGVLEMTSDSILVDVKRKRFIAASSI